MMIKSLKNDTILFSTKEEYINWIKTLAKEYFENWNGAQLDQHTIFGSLEGFLYFVGVSLGDDDEYDIDKFKIENEELFPTSFPCLFLTYSCNGLSYAGSKSQTVHFSDVPVFVYLTDFDKN